MTPLEHDGAASLRVRYLRARVGIPTFTGAGWYVVRICPCHWGRPITMPFETQALADAALAFCDADAKRWAA